MGSPADILTQVFKPFAVRKELCRTVLCASIFREGGFLMSPAKNEGQSLLNKLPDDCTMENIQYHFYVVEKVHRGIARGEKEGVISQQDVEQWVSKWHTD